MIYSISVKDKIMCPTAGCGVVVADSASVPWQGLSVPSPAMTCLFTRVSVVDIEFSSEQQGRVTLLQLSFPYMTPCNRTCNGQTVCGSDRIMVS